MIVNAKAVKPVASALGGAPYEAGPVLDFLKDRVKRLVVVDGEGVSPAAAPKRRCEYSIAGRGRQGRLPGHDCGGPEERHKMQGGPEIP